MGDDSKLLCDPADKAALEAANGASQLDHIAELVLDREVQAVRESHLLDLQKLAVLGIYPCGGQYRTALMRVEIQHSEHRLPEAAFVPALVAEAIDWVNNAAGRPAIERASYILWRINWIHPFAGGNGRTARAMAYLVLCMDIHGMIPGLPSFPSRIYERREEYVRALQIADRSVRDGAEDPDLTAMGNLIRDVVMQQMAMAIYKLDSFTQ